ncbi:Frataxin [Fomitopsis betulina]|nr:Frataxin [Fomitopsis betulina]
MWARSAAKSTRRYSAGQPRLTSSSASTSRSTLRLAACAREAVTRSVLPALSLPPRQCRSYATPPPQVVHSDLTTEKYNTYSDATMDQMLESIETLLDDLGDPHHEVEYSSGVLTLKLGEKATYVINKQPPNKQIWLSSPFSGPKRYDYSESLDEWVYNRDNSTLGELLDKELSAALGREVRLGVTRISRIEV